MSALARAGLRSSLVVVSTLHGATDANFATFHYFAAHHHLVKDLIHLVEVEDEVKLAHATEVLIENFHKQVDEFKHGQLVVIRVDTQSEK